MIWVNVNVKTLTHTLKTCVCVCAVMTERTASGGAASLTAALPREGVHGRRHTPKHRGERATDNVGNTLKR